MELNMALESGEGARVRDQRRAKEGKEGDRVFQFRHRSWSVGITPGNDGIDMEYA